MAVWIETGSVVSAGSKRSSAASTASRSCSKKSGRFIARALKQTEGCLTSRFGLGFGFKRLGRELSVGFLQQNFNTPFGFFQLFLALARKSHALFKKLHGIVKRELRAFEAANHFFQACKGTLEIWFFRCRRIHASTLSFVIAEVSAGNVSHLQSPWRGTCQHSKARARRDTIALWCEDDFYFRPLNSTALKLTLQPILSRVTVPASKLACVSVWIFQPRR